MRTLPRTPWIVTGEAVEVSRDASSPAGQASPPSAD